MGGLAPGTILAGRYRIDRLLAEGGMGAVYEARHLELDRPVAIKTLLSELQDQPRLIQRFIREARATCTIAHPNVVSVLDVDQTADGVIFFAMEYLAGADLMEVLAREGPLPWPRAIRIALQVCAALGSAHERGVVHRDLKPSNCFLVRDDQGDDLVKILDFGIAKVLESSAQNAPHRGPGPTTGRELRWLKTSTGEVFGTLAYMAPEHLNGAPHDHRVDIYALGVILHEMLTGATPFSPDAPGTFIQQVLFEPPDPPSQRAPRAAIPPDLDYVVLRALEKRPEDRFTSMDELAAALAAVRREAAPPIALAWTPAALAPTTAPSTAPPAQPTNDRTRFILGACAGLLTALILGFLLLRTPKTSPDPITTTSRPSDPIPTAPSDPITTQQSALEPRTPPTQPTALAPATPTSLDSPAPPTIDPPPPAPLEPPASPAPPQTAPSQPGAPLPADIQPSRPRTRPRDLPAMVVTPFERHQLFATHRDAITARCKRPHNLENALLVLLVTIEAARIVRATLASTNDLDRRAAAACIQKYLRTRVQVPRTLSGRANFSYAF